MVTLACLVLLYRLGEGTALLQLALWLLCCHHALCRSLEWPIGWLARISPRQYQAKASPSRPMLSGRLPALYLLYQIHVERAFLAGRFHFAALEPGTKPSETLFVPHGQPDASATSAGPRAGHETAGEPAPMLLLC